MNIAIPRSGAKKKNAPVVWKKKGINLARTQRNPRKIASLCVGIPVALVLCAAFVKFGVMDLNAQKEAAATEYTVVHTRLLNMQKTADTYDEVLLRYRTLATDWMQDDTSGKYVSVERIKVLRMLEAIVLLRGKVDTITISGETVSIAMSGMNLNEIVSMFNELEEFPFVSECILQNARTTDGTEIVTDVENEASNAPLSFNMTIKLQSESRGE